MGKMKKTILLLTSIVIGTTTTIFAQNSNYIKKEIPISKLEHISISNGFSLILTNSPETSLTIETDNRTFDLLDIDISNNGVSIKTNNSRGGWWKNRTLSKVYIHISSPNIASIRLSGGSTAKGEINNSNNLEIKMSGGSKTYLNGKVPNLRILASGGSKFISENFSCDTLKISMSGGSKATLHINNNFDFKGSGGSKLRYSGSPTYKTSLSGGSSISRSN